MSLFSDLDFRPPYPAEILSKPYPKDYVCPKFRKYNGKQGSAKEDIVGFLDDLGKNGMDHELRFREFAKALTERAYSWYANLAPESIKTWGIWCPPSVPSSLWWKKR